MKEEWKRVTVSEICELIVDCVNKTAPVVEEATPYKMLRTTNIKGGRIDRENCRRVTKETYQKWTRRAEVRCGDVILTREAPMGEIGYVDFDDTVFLGQRLMQYRANPELLEPRFLQYAFLSRDLQNQFAAHDGSGSTVSHIRVGDCSKFQINLPPLPEQKAIAAVLGALDDKIAANAKLNHHLEQIARALFQSWFVDFDPVRAKLDGREPPGLDSSTASLFPDSFQGSPLGLLPQGWETGSILRQADLLSGGTPKTDVSAYWNGDVPWASAKDVSQCGEAFLVSTERTITNQGVKESSTKIIPANVTVVVARGATTGRLTMFGHAMAMNQTCYGLRSKIDAPFALYCNVRHFVERLVQGGHGSIFDTITTSTFEATKVLLAPKEVLLAFDRQVTPLFQQVHANLHQSRTLATLRDTLLPKLLSGELSVVDVAGK